MHLLLKVLFALLADSFVLSELFLCCLSLIDQLLFSAVPLFSHLLALVLHILLQPLHLFLDAIVILFQLALFLLALLVELRQLLFH